MRAGAAKLSEKAFQAQVLQLARALGWLCFHTYDSRRCTPGFPDLVLVKRRVVWAEVKVEGGRLTAAQRLWLDSLRAAGAEAYCWAPRDWNAIQRVLGGG